MAIITYPLNGIDYDAENAETYLCTRTSGIYSADGSFQASVTGDRQVSISSGLAWIQNTDFAGKSVCNTESVAVEIPLADGTRPRIDRIVLRFDKAANASSIVLKQGTPSSTPAAPTVERTELVYELGLCTVQVPAASTIVSAGNVTSTLLDESVCGLMRDGVTGIPTEQLQEQVTALLADLRVAFEKQLDLQEQDFDAWFETIKGKLGDDPATALQAQVDDLQAAVGGMPLELSAGTNSIQIVADENRVGNVSVDGFTTQTGTGDPAPDNVREIENAGKEFVKVVFDGSSDESWKYMTGTGHPYFSGTFPNFAVYGTGAYSTNYKFGNVLGTNDVQGFSVFEATLTVRDYNIQSLEDFKAKLSANPLTVIYTPQDASNVTGVYTFTEVEQDGAYHCDIVELKDRLHIGDKLDTNIRSECDKSITFDETGVWTLAATGVFRSSLPDMPGGGNTVTVLSNRYFPANNPTVDTTTWPDKSIQAGISAGSLYVKDTSFGDDVSAFKEAFKTNPLRVWYKSTSGGAPKNIKREEHAHKTLVLDGTTMKFTKSDSYWNLPNKSAPNVAASPKCLCSALPGRVFQANTTYNFLFAAEAQVSPYFATVDECNAFLVQQYTAGTPVTVEYDIAEIETYADEPVQLENPQGASTVSSEESTTLTVAISAPVGRVNGKTGASITLTAGDVGALPKAAGSYSTSEVNTGKTWVDGKTIYRRVFKLTGQQLPQTGFSTYVPLSSFPDVDQIVNITAMLYLNDADITARFPIMMPCALGDSVIMVQTSSRGVELFRVVLSATGSGAYPTGNTNGMIFIVEYTKK